MLKKIHSNRDPNDTLFSELKKEFGAYFGKAENCAKSVLEKHSRIAFRLMVAILAISIILSFTIFRKRPLLKATPSVKANAPAVINDGFGRILQAGSALREMINLKKQVDSISAKHMLTAQDSLLLEKDLDKLQRINQTNNNKTYGH